MLFAILWKIVVGILALIGGAVIGSWIYIYIAEGKEFTIGYAKEVWHLAEDYPEAMVVSTKEES